MMFNLSVHNSDIEFECEEGQTILDAAEQAGYRFPYSCRKGVCSSCEGEIISGEFYIRKFEVSKGPLKNVPFCQAKPVSDIVIDPLKIENESPPARKILLGKVKKLEWLTDDVAFLKLRFPNGIRVPFIPGQHLQVQLGNGETRSYSMANSPHANSGVELHIRRLEGGEFSDKILNGLVEDNNLTVELPFGTFCMATPTSELTILVATGTGFAPFRSMLEWRIKERLTHPVHLYWGGRSRVDLYENTRIEGWVRRFDWLKYTPVLSQPDRAWKGRRGYVQSAVLEDYPDMSQSIVYACGSQAMINASRVQFTSQAGLNPNNFNCEAFVQTISR